MCRYRAGCMIRAVVSEPSWMLPRHAVCRHPAPTSRTAQTVAFRCRIFGRIPPFYANIAMNPPYNPKAAVEIITHALTHVVEGGRVAVLALATFLHSQRRYPLFARPEC